MKEIPQIFNPPSTPHEHALALINKYYYMLPNNGDLYNGINSCESRYKEAIECSLIGIENLILELEFTLTKMMDTDNDLQDYIMKKINFYDEIETQIHKIKQRKNLEELMAKDQEDGMYDIELYNTGSL
jgi:hypothetical protein